MNDLSPGHAGTRPSLGMRMRFTIARRMVQFGVLVAFFGTLHWGWAVAGRPLLAGDLSSARFLDVLPLSDPFAVLQMLVARHLLASEVLLGAGVTLAMYGLLGGRVFCAWVCPMNIVTDAAFWVRSRLRRGAHDERLRVPPQARYVILALALLLSALTGYAAFEWFSPVSMLHRELLYGPGLGLTAAAGIFVLDAFALRHGWCGRLCPLGAFWSIVGRIGRLKIAFDEASCSRCGECVKACPEPQVLHFGRMSRRGFVAPGECTSCACCIAICPESSLRFALRAPAGRSVSKPISSSIPGDNR